MFRVKSSLSSEIFHVTKSNGGCCVSCSPNICLVQEVPPRDKKGHNHRRQGTSLQAKRKQVQIKMSHVSPLSVMNRVRRTRLLQKSSCVDKAAKARGIRSDGVAEHRNEKNSVLFRKHLTGEEVGGGSVTTKEALC